MLDIKSIHRSIRVLHKSSFLANFWSNYKRSTHLVKYLRDSVQLDVGKYKEAAMGWCLPQVSISSCQRNLIKTFQIEGMIEVITKMLLIFS